MWGPFERTQGHFDCIRKAGTPFTRAAYVERGSMSALDRLLTRQTDES